MKTKGKLDSRNNSIHISQKGSVKNCNRNMSMTSSLTGFGAEKLIELSKNNIKHLSPTEKFEIQRV